ncbi:hypothetical protein [Streptomyces sp. NPDC056132]|uniref:hypothetical protein n=1 Tax=Streptomyces sp. NPDC056132 TaxID=3345722 RepID=UPI0035DB5C0F
MTATGAALLALILGPMAWLVVRGERTTGHGTPQARGRQRNENTTLVRDAPMKPPPVQDLPSLPQGAATTGVLRSAALSPLPPVTPRRNGPSLAERAAARTSGTTPDTLNRITRSPDTVPSASAFQSAL